MTGNTPIFGDSMKIPIQMVYEVIHLNFPLKGKRFTNTLGVLWYWSSLPLGERGFKLMYNPTLVPRGTSEQFTNLLPYLVILSDGGGRGIIISWDDSRTEKTQNCLSNGLV